MNSLTTTFNEKPLDGAAIISFLFCYILVLISDFDTKGNVCQQILMAFGS